MKLIEKARAGLDRAKQFGTSVYRTVERNAKALCATGAGIIGFGAADSAMAQTTPATFPTVSFPYDPATVVDSLVTGGIEILTQGFPVVLGIGFVMGLVYWIFGAFRR